MSQTNEEKRFQQQPEEAASELLLYEMYPSPKL